LTTQARFFVRKTSLNYELLIFLFHRVFFLKGFSFFDFIEIFIFEKSFRSATIFIFLFYFKLVLKEFFSRYPLLTSQITGCQKLHSEAAQLLAVAG